MDSSMSSTDSARLPDYPMVSPDNRLQPTVEPLSTKREREESRSASRFGTDERFFSRVVRSAPIAARTKHRVAPHAHAIIFHTPPNTPNSPRPVEFEKSNSVYCRTDHECVSVPIESKFYDISKRSTYFDQCFTIEDKLGEGSFGEVFQARCLEDSQVYAVKRAIEPYRSITDRALKLREVKMHEELTPHPNLIYFHRAWEERGRLYIQTELCTKSLADYCKWDAPPINEIWDILFDVVNATDYLHSKNYIHLDIKPENIFLTKDKVCKLGDFGLMFDLNHDHMATVEEGDSKYLAPEVLNNPPTQAADIFSIGMSILEVSTNLDLPTEGENWHALRTQRVPDRFLDLLEPEMRRLILWMISPEPEDRPSTQDLINDSAVYWPFLKRKKLMDVGQKVSTVSGHFSFLSSWASALWRTFLAPIQSSRLGKLIADTRRKRTRADEVADQSKTPEQKRQRRFEASTPDYDSSFSDEEDSRHKLLSARCLTQQFYSDAPPVLKASDSPFRVYDENRDRLDKQRKRMQTPPSPTGFASPVSPLYVHAGGAASAPLGYSRRRAAAACARDFDDDDDVVVVASAVPRRLQLDSDSDESEHKVKAAAASTPKTPLNTTMSTAARQQSRRSTLRSLDSPRTRRLDFSLLDDVVENEAPAGQENDVICRTPSPSQQQHLRRRHHPAAGDA